MKLSQWHRKDVKPVHIGLYKVMNEFFPTGWAVWSGKFWEWTAWDKKSAIQCYKDGFGESSIQDNQWRGIVK